MIGELRVENLLLIERAELELGSGLNVLTGETGAGKTVLTSALDLLLGGRSSADVVRPGASEAYVEGVFELPQELCSELDELIPQGSDELVLARKISSSGRSRAYIAGRSVSVSDLRVVAEKLLTFYGQHEHRKLTVASAQLEILDSFGGEAQAGLKESYREAYDRVRVVRQRVEELNDLEISQLESLRHELSEIEAAAPSVSEESELIAERERLRHQESLRTAVSMASSLLDSDGEAPAAISLLGGALHELEAVEGIDPQLDPLCERLRALTLESGDLVSELRNYEESFNAEFGRLEEVEQRLALFEDLKRKYGTSVDQVTEHAARCQEQITALDGLEQTLAEAHAELGVAESSLAEVAKKLRAARSHLGKKLSSAVIEQLGQLAMEGALFSVELGDSGKAGPTGGDTVEFMLTANPGVPAGAIREIASGGELSRVMLALLTVANEHSTTTLVFDEIDAGIGGQTARAVGEMLRELAIDRQILLITHLPQIAALAERHFRIDKAVGEVTKTSVVQLDDEATVSELARMLGASQKDSAAREHARKLRESARASSNTDTVKV